MKIPKFKIGDKVKYKPSYRTSNTSWYCYNHHLLATYKVVEVSYSDLALKCNICKKTIYSHQHEVMPHDWVIIRLKATNQ